uniref:Uncharacterized protein n=1 Tax=Rhizophora mucronata TaxID=61149 RepID=A0A2P2PE47_RHIMU
MLVAPIYVSTDMLHYLRC